MGTTPSKIESKHYDEFEKGLPSLAGKTVVITGCTSGTGLVAAKDTVRKGAATLLMLNRPSARATAAEELVKKEIPEGSTNVVVETIPCDLQDFESVQAAAALIKKKYEAIDVLCCNAGVMALDDYATKDGYDVQMQTNHLSHFLLIKELFPLLQRAKELRKEARIVHHSSGSRAHPSTPLQAEYFGKNGGNLGGNQSFFFTGPKWERYHQTKLANAVMTLALADRLKDSGGIKAACAAPGLANTDLQKSTTQNGGGMSGSMWIMRFSQSAEDGTMPLLAACFDPTTENGDFWEPSQTGRTVGPAAKFELEPICQNEESRKILWEESEKCCGKFECD